MLGQGFDLTLLWVSRASAAYRGETEARRSTVSIQSHRAVSGGAVGPHALTHRSDSFATPHRAPEAARRLSTPSVWAPPWAGVSPLPSQQAREEVL